MTNRLDRLEDKVTRMRDVVHSAGDTTPEPSDLSLSVGIAIYPDNGEEVGTLLKNSETAMHNAKERGPGTFCFFTPAMNTLALEKLGIENALRGAIG